MSRERLLGILWPEGDEERGRHALAQTVYSLRRDLGNEAAIAGAAKLRLEPTEISSDVADFAVALSAGDHEAVARLYTGPFLDGFYLSDAPEFERCVEVERARLAGSAVRILEQLAESGEKAGRHADALTCWRRLTQLDPLRGKFAVAYMGALAATGDRAGALAHARTHEALLRRELDAAPEAEVTRLAVRLRSEAAQPEASSTTSWRPPAPDGPAPDRRAPPAVEPGRRRPAKLVALAAVLAVGAFLAWRSSIARGVSGLPLLAVGSVQDAASRDTTGSGAVLTDMLATSLARIPGLQVVANSQLLELVPRGTDTVPGSFSAAAREAGAQEILEGELAFAPDGGLQLELRRIDLMSGVLRQGYSVRAFDRYAAVDSATVIIAEGFGLLAPTKPIAEVSTSSPIAYQARRRQALDWLAAIGH